MTWLEKLPYSSKSFCGLSLLISSVASGLLGIILATGYIWYYFNDCLYGTWLMRISGCMATFFLVFSFILLIGIIKSSEFLVLAWIWFAFLFLAVTFALAMRKTFFEITAGRFWMDCVGLAWVAVYSVFIYLILVVNSYRQDIHVEPTPPEEEEEY